MNNFVRRITFPVVFIILVSIHSSINLKIENENRALPLLNAQGLSKSPKMSFDSGRIPLYFIANEGQVDEQALFYAKASRYTLWLTKDGLVFDNTKKIDNDRADLKSLNPRDANRPVGFKYDRDVSRLVFINANRSPEVISLDDTEHKVNYFIGNNKSKWRTNIQTSRAVLYKELYPGIDLKVFGVEKQIEYDFIVRPGGDVANIGFKYLGVKKTGIDETGNLKIEAKFDEFLHAKPACFQVIGGKRIDVRAEFKKTGNNTYGFHVEQYDKNRELIIDPLVFVIEYSTYLGGSNYDHGECITVDAEGAPYVTGWTLSANFPTLHPIQPDRATHVDVFVTKINSSGTGLVYSTYLGGSDRERGHGIAVDSEGAAYVTGFTTSADFPIWNPFQGSRSGIEDAFITKINPSGIALDYSTYLGGSNRETGNGIAVDSEGAAYVAGFTNSADFPTWNPLQGSRSGMEDAFITKIDSSGTGLVYSTYLGGSGFDGAWSIALDSAGAAYVTGRTNSSDFPVRNPIQSYKALWLDVFITKIDPSGTGLVYSTYLGGSGYDLGHDIAVDSEGAAYVIGDTGSVNFPVWDPIQSTNKGGDRDVFLTKIDSAGTGLVYSTYLGGSGNDRGWGIAVDAEGAAYVTGWTGSDDFPVWNSFQRYKAKWDDAFIAKIDSSGTGFVYSTYLGGSDFDGAWSIALDSAGAACVTGRTSSSDFPTRVPFQFAFAGLGDVFLTKIASIRRYTLSLVSSPGGTTSPQPGTYSYNEGTSVTITAVPNSRFRFSQWSGDMSSLENPLIITIDSDKSIKANFIRQYTLTLTSGFGGTVNPLPGTYFYDKGSVVKVTAIPDAHYRFMGWSADVSSTENPVAIAMSSDISLHASFIRIIYAPSRFTGQKVLNRSLSQAEYINVLTWQANPDNINIAKYRIYLIEGENRNLLIELDTGIFRYWHRRVDKNKPYVYALCAVNDAGNEGQQTILTIQ